ncbi:MAG: CDP-alcohol phosphatidyltransferase family protein [Candidatus Nealsonbacteria bacterium]
MGTNQVKFKGDKKTSTSILFGVEAKFVEKTIGLIPKWIETYYLTMMTLVWSGLVVCFGYLAKNDNLNWLWMVSLMVLLQYLTDLFDGKIGKLKNTGLIRWGYYMDHFLDYIFLSSILFAYSFFLPENMKSFGFWMAIVAIGFVVNSYLGFASTDKFKIYFFRIGPTEARLLFILLNIFIIFAGVKTFLTIIPWFVVIASLSLLAVVFRMQRKIWKMDMEQKSRK